MTDYQFQFIVRKGPNIGDTIAISAPAMVVGRDPMSDIVINDPEVSRQHARLTRIGDTYQIQDLGSTNGTFINGDRLTATPHLLQNGDKVSMGSSVTLDYNIIAVQPPPPPVDPQMEMTMVGDPGDLATPPAEDFPADDFDADFDDFSAVPATPAPAAPQPDPFDDFQAPPPPVEPPGAAFPMPGEQDLDPFDDFDSDVPAPPPPPLAEPDPFDDFQAMPPSTAPFSSEPAQPAPPQSDPFDSFQAAPPPPAAPPQYAQPAAALPADDSKKKRNRTILIVIGLLLLCCCILVVVLWFTGDAIVQFLEDQGLTGTILPLLHSLS